MPAKQKASSGFFILLGYWMLATKE